MAGDLEQTRRERTATRETQQCGDIATSSDPNHDVRARLFGENVRDARERAGLSQSQLAQRVQVDRAAISLYERGAHAPSLHTIVRLANALEITAGQLLRGL
jgi:ribosome-binding protein aMBF1 (putative translation factor)